MTDFECLSVLQDLRTYNAHGVLTTPDSVPGDALYDGALYHAIRALGERCGLSFDEIEKFQIINPKTFRPGQSYEWTDRFTKKQITYQISKRNNNQLTICVKCDKTHQQTKIFNIETDNDQNERFLISTSNGQKGYIYAK